MATPLEWTEVEDPRLTPDRYTISNIFDRLRREGDLWKDLGRKAQALSRQRLH